MPEYIYESNKNRELSTNEAIIVLPDIYGQTDYSKRTVEEFAEMFKKPTFLLDYFYLSTGEANSFNENDREKTHDLMQNLKGDDFVSFFEKTLDEIQGSYPSITSFAVVGFCFGGRLAYIAGGSDFVTKVISFYGGGANTPGYIKAQTPLEYLISRRSTGNISVNSFFGTNDPSIPEEDRLTIKGNMNKAGIDYHCYEYEAGHAYFQEGRKNYNEIASSASWGVLKEIFHV